MVCVRRQLVLNATVPSAGGSCQMCSVNTHCLLDQMYCVHAKHWDSEHVLNLYISCANFWDRIIADGPGRKCPMLAPRSFSEWRASAQHQVRKRRKARTWLREYLRRGNTARRMASSKSLVSRRKVLFTVLSMSRLAAKSRPNPIFPIVSKDSRCTG